MSRGHGVRRAIAEIRWDDGAGVIASVGNRSVHHYWALLSSYFRDVLLPPQRRAEENGVTWTWREPADAPAVSASELRTVRKRLADEQQLFTDNLVRGGLGGDAAGLRGQVNVDELAAVMAQVVAGLIERDDASLAGYVCRTETGLRIHSWGAAVPARPTYPEASGLEIAGHVLVGGRPARHDVVLEGADGETIAETPSDASGEFRFSKLSPGDYRLRARTMRGTFPLHGLAVSLKRESVTDVVLSDGNASPPTAVASRRARGGGRRVGIALTLIAVVGSIVAWRWKASRSAVPPVEVATTEKESSAENRGAVSPETEKRTTSASRSNESRKTTSVDAPRTTTAAGERVSPVEPGGVGRREQIQKNRDATPPGESVMREREVGAPVASGLPVPAKGQPQRSSAPAANAAAGGTRAAGQTTPTPGAVGKSSAAATNTGATSGTAPASATPAASGPVASERPDAASAASPTPNQAKHQPPDTKTDPVPSTPSPIKTLALATTEPGALPVETPETDPARAKEEPRKTATNVAPETAPTPDRASPVEAKPDAPSTRPRGEIEPPGQVRNEPTDATPSTAPATSVPPSTTPGTVRPRMMVIEPLSRTVRARLSPWRTRVLADVILPTQPLRADQPETIEALRSRLLAEQAARMPATFRAPDARVGVVLSLPAAPRSRERLFWRDGDGKAPADATVSETTAQIDWAAGEEIAERVFRLQHGDGRIIAEVRIDAGGREIFVRTVDDARAWLRLAFRIDSADTQLSPAADGTGRFVWRTSSGAPLPVTWPPPAESARVGEAGVHVPLGGAPGAAALQGCALLDQKTGWAMVSDIRQAADRPLGQ